VADLAQRADAVELAVEDLPIYMGEPPVRSRPTPAAAWSVIVPSSGARGGRGSTPLVMTRIVPLVPSVAVDALMGWFRARNGSPITFRHSYFGLSEPAVRHGSLEECRMNVQHHRSLAWRPTVLEIEISPWSSSLTELDLRPLRWKVSPSEAYFAAGHALLDMLERAMAAHAARRPVLRRRTGLGTG